MDQYAFELLQFTGASLVFVAILFGVIYFFLRQVLKTWNDSRTDHVESLEDAILKFLVKEGRGEPVFYQKLFNTFGGGWWWQRIIRRRRILRTLDVMAKKKLITLEESAPNGPQSDEWNGADFRLVVLTINGMRHFRYQAA